MDSLQKGDVITDKYGLAREVVVARLEDLVFTKVLHDNKADGSPLGPSDIGDLAADGWIKEEV